MSSCSQITRLNIWGRCAGGYVAEELVKQFQKTDKIISVGTEKAGAGWPGGEMEASLPASCRSPKDASLCPKSKGRHEWLFL